VEEARLRQFIGMSLRHAERTLDWLHADETRWDEPVAGHPGVGLLEKIHSELALLAWTCHRGGMAEPEIDARVRAIAVRLGALATRARTLGRVMRLPHLSPAFALPVHLREQVLGDSGLAARLLRRSLQHPLVDGLERYPFRRLDVAWIKALFGLTDQARDPALIRSTCLAMPVHPIYASLTDVYALTHAFAYDTDFGHACPSAAYDLQAVERTLQATASFALCEGDADVLAEVLMCAWAMPEPPWWAPALTDVVLALWQRFGFVPPADFEFGIAAASSRPEDRQRYMLRATYHPTTVAGLMAAVAWAAAGRPPSSHRAESARHAARRAAADGMDGLTLRGLDALGCRNAPIARQMLDAAVERCHAAPEIWILLADAVLIQACRGYELDLVLEVLHAAAPHSAASASVTEAMLFFRGQECEGLYGAHFFDETAAVSTAARELAAICAERLKSIDARMRPALREIDQTACP